MTDIFLLFVFSIILGAGLSIGILIINGIADTLANRHKEAKAMTRSETLTTLRQQAKKAPGFPEDLRRQLSSLPRDQPIPPELLSRIISLELDDPRC